MNGINIALPENPFSQITQQVPLRKQDNPRLFTHSGSMFAPFSHVVWKAFPMDVSPGNQSVFTKYMPC
jgi:hypothetical protein